ncbi:zonular occludens toxin family protein [Methylomonas methanica]|uniref:Zonular occludens toxin n=1 Tax=Methylomonas methanica (strain DSM 25384 / MC09) TaxID=857087 RepID=F9ZVC3_METMM|nr:zonular occludens toxin domain-containing protein [Methylomonas methanica]AEG00733.1 Zonular occludens toxin [Methylomonas methanica MC09]
MATSIHHGPPGSFKSFTLVQRFAIDALKEGRVVITNIRGLTSIDRIQDQFPDYKFPDSADLWFINTDEEKYRQFMARWFHWVPLRALIIIDECQRVYPNRRDFRKEDLDKCDLMGFQPEPFNVEINDEYTGAKYIVHRPKDVDTAFDMQRHFNWDVYLSTPNIAKVKDFIREVAQTAYRHKSLGELLPLFFKNTWYEFQHDSENSGKLTSHISGKPRKYKADERIFNCYQSTATGEHIESKANQSVFGDAKVKFLLFVIVLAFSGFIYSVIQFASIHGDKSPPVSDAEALAGSPGSDKTRGAVSSKNPGASAGVARVDHVPLQQGGGFFDSLGFNLVQVAKQDLADLRHDVLMFLADSQDGLQVVRFTDLYNAGVRASVHGLCKIKLIAPDGSILDLGCTSALVSVCAAVLDTPTKVVRRDCHKYGEPKQQPDLPQNALVASASKILE